MINDTLLNIAMNHAERLILKAQSGDDQAFNKLMSLWYKRIYNYSLKYAGSHDLAMDIAQNTFIAVHRNLNQLKAIENFKSWLYRITINCCHEEMRKIKKTESINKTATEDTAQAIEIEEDIRYQPDSRLQRQELADLILASLQTLSEEQRVVVIMKEYEGLKFREIAEALDISENTAKSRLYYGLTHLRSKLANVMSEHQITVK